MYYNYLRTFIQFSITTHFRFCSIYTRVKSLIIRFIYRYILFGNRYRSICTFHREYVIIYLIF